MNLKGSLPLLILHVLSEGQSHGYQIAGHIKARSGGVLDFKEGTLYPTLHTLEKQRLIVSHAEIENGRRRRYYRLTDAGRKALTAHSEEWRRFSGAVNQVLQEGQA
jgi:PadR family transcriptional regulator, regulatory protein PadR